MKKIYGTFHRFAICLSITLSFVSCSIFSNRNGFSEEQQPIQVATYNILGPAANFPNDWKSRFPRLLQTIRENKYEIFGVQEGLKEPMDDLAKALDFQYFGISRDGNGVEDYNPVFYDPRKFKVIESGTFWLSEQPDTPRSSSWNSAMPRICTWGLMEDLRSHNRFVFANTHLDFRSREARTQGASLIVHKLIDKIRNYPFILTGDFNSVAEELPPQFTTALMDSRGISETEHTGAPSVTFHGFRENTSRSRMRGPSDFVWVNKQVRVLKHCAVNDFREGLASSDHFSVTALIVPLRCAE